jgi:hypothetical protein
MAAELGEMRRRVASVGSCVIEGGADCRVDDAVHAFHLRVVSRGCSNSCPEKAKPMLDFGWRLVGIRGSRRRVGQGLVPFGRRLLVARRHRGFLFFFACALFRG